MKKIIALFVLVALCGSVMAQSAKVSKPKKSSANVVLVDGKYVAKSVANKSVDKPADEKVGIPYRHTDGKDYDVYRGPRGGLYAMVPITRGENKGQLRKKYLKVEEEK